MADHVRFNSFLRLWLPDYWEPHINFLVFEAWFTIGSQREMNSHARQHGLPRLGCSMTFKEFWGKTVQKQ